MKAQIKSAKISNEEERELLKDLRELGKGTKTKRKTKGKRKAKRKAKRKTKSKKRKSKRRKR